MEAPSSGVLVVAQKNPGEHATIMAESLVHGRDFYVWRRGQWFAMDVFGLAQYISEPKPEGFPGLTILLGVYTDKATWDEVFAKAVRWNG